MAGQGIQPPGAAVVGAAVAGAQPQGDGAQPVPNVGDDAVVKPPVITQP